MTLKKKQGGPAYNMPKQFDEISKQIEACKKCKLHKGIRNYVPGIIGLFRPDIVMVGEAPGAMEDILGEPFVGRSGKILNDAMSRLLGLQRGDFSILNSVKCRPPDNREPTEEEKLKCRPWLLAQLRCIEPTIVVTLGVHGAIAILGERKHIDELRSHYYRIEEIGCDVVPTFHPMATAYVKARKEAFESDIKSLGELKYRESRKDGRCSFPSDAPQGIDGYGIALP